MRKIKKLLAFVMVMLIIISSVAVATSGISLLTKEKEEKSVVTLDFDSFKSDYPYVFVHGMGGWGSDSEYYEDSPYWGGGLIPGQKTDLIEILNSKGIEAYAPSVAPLSSAWDRACELYARLTGTVVDYGEAHSKAHNHERFGFSYVGEPYMGEAWNLEDKINLVGHSFGGATVRLFTSLLAYGSADEVAATKEETSELFTGGHNSIHSCITLSAPHNGSQVANLIVDTKVPLFFIATGIHLIGATKGNYFPPFSFQLGQFGITPKQNEERARFNLSKALDFYKAKDNCGYDLTLAGAAELNSTIRLAPETYYYSYTTVSTETVGAFGTQVPTERMNSLFKISSAMISLSAGKTVDGIKMEGDWLVNDGIVPLASSLYPLCDADTALDYEEADSIEPGRWYYMDTMYDMDHFDFCGTDDYPTTMEDFYFGMINTVNSR